MAGNRNSGRKPRREEERKLIGKHFKGSVSLVVETMVNTEVPWHVRVDCAKLLIEQHIGKPGQRIEHAGDDHNPIVITRVEIIKDYGEQGPPLRLVEGK